MEEVKTEEQSGITEALIVIGRDAVGRILIQFDNQINPAAVCVLLEQMRLQLVGQFNFQRQGKIELVKGMPAVKH